jgi:hypothetical protein
VGLAVITGCASGDDSTDSGGCELSAPAASAAWWGAPPAAHATAKVTTKKVDQGDRICQLVLQLPVVDAGDPAVNAKIAKVLDSADPENGACDNLLPDETKEVLFEYHVTTNERGILAMTLEDQEVSQTTSDSETTVIGLTFDLATGTQLELTDVLTAAGMKTAQDMCVASLAKNLAGVEARTSPRSKTGRPHAASRVLRRRIRSASPSRRTAFTSSSTSWTRSWGSASRCLPGTS